jgi:hypothetical protein
MPAIASQAHIDGHVLRLPAAHFPDFGGRQSGGGNAHLRGGGDAKRGRQLRLLAGQRQRVKHGSLPTGGSPDVAKDFVGASSRALHSRASCLAFENFCPTTEGVAMAALDPLTAGAVFLATAATDAVYVMFTSAVVARKRVPAATWSSVWYVLSSYAVISYTENWMYVAFAAIGSWVGAYLTITFLHRPPGGPPVGAAPE